MIWLWLRLHRCLNWSLTRSGSPKVETYVWNNIGIYRLPKQERVRSKNARTSFTHSHVHDDVAEIEINGVQLPLLMWTKSTLQLWSSFSWITQCNVCSLTMMWTCQPRGTDLCHRWTDELHSFWLVLVSVFSSSSRSRPWSRHRAINSIYHEHRNKAKSTAESKSKNEQNDNDEESHRGKAHATTASSEV